MSRLNQLNSLKTRNGLFSTLVLFSVCSVLGALGLILFDVLKEGAQVLSWDFFSSDPIASGRQGGIFPILVSTSLIMLVGLGAALPLGVGTAIFLAEFDGASAYSKKGAFWVRHSLDILAGVPSIVFGLFGNAFFCVYLGMSFSILSGGLTLACMVLPLLVRSIEQSLRNVPQAYKAGSAALGFSKVSSLIHILIPVALPGIAAATLLSFGRAMAETAALVFTSGYVDRLPTSIFDSGRSLSIHIYDLAMNIPGGDRMAYGSSLVLIVVVLLASALSSYFVNYLVRQRGGVYGS